MTMAKEVGRLIGLQWNHGEGGDVLSTRLYFEDGTTLLLEGHLDVTLLSTLKVKYDKDAGEPYPLSKLELMAG